MDLRQYTAALQYYTRELPQRVEEIALEKAGAALVRKMKIRIFQGLDRNLKIFAEGYSTAPMYVTKDQFVKRSTFKPRGKFETGSKKADGSERRSMFLPHGYKELKEIQGLGSEIINITYTGALKKAYVSELDNGALLIGFNSEKEAQKADWLEDKYKTDIFHAADEELMEYYDRLVVEMKKLYKSFFSE